MCGNIISGKFTTAVVRYLKVIHLDHDLCASFQLGTSLDMCRIDYFSSMTISCKDEESILATCHKEMHFG